jgi:DNA-binding MurR/RpiR family transcriptional regulator
MAYGEVLRETEVTLSRAREIGAPVVLLTDTLGVALADRITVALSATRGAAGMWSSITTTAVLIDALLFGIAIADRPKALTTLEELMALRTQITGRPFRVSRRTRR